MNSELLIRDPVFQLNLLLWMAKEQPPQGYVVRPLFFEYGFGFIYIENPFKFPQETLAAIESSSQNISKEPEPELLLGRRVDNIALYFEAKADSFSTASTNAKQARGHLLAVGPVFAEVMTPYQSCLLCYVVPEEKCGLMRGCLTELTMGLSKERLQPGPYSSHGLAVREQDLHYSWDDSLNSTWVLQQTLPSSCRASRRIPTQALYSSSTQTRIMQTRAGVTCCGGS